MSCAPHRREIVFGQNIQLKAVTRVAQMEPGVCKPSTTGGIILVVRVGSIHGTQRTLTSQCSPGPWEPMGPALLSACRRVQVWCHRDVGGKVSMGGLGDRYYVDGDVAYRKRTACTGHSSRVRTLVGLPRSRRFVLLLCSKGYSQGCRVWGDSACFRQRFWCEARPLALQVTVNGLQIPACALASRRSMSTRHSAHYLMRNTLCLLSWWVLSWTSSYWHLRRELPIMCGSG